MITITRTFEWDMGHRVTNHDSLCKNPHGHRYKMDVTIGGPISTKVNESDQGMVLDFGHLKTIINEKIVDRLDHSFMYWNEDEVILDFATQNPSLRMVAVNFIPTAECIVQYIADELTKSLAKELPSITLEKIELFETPKCRAIWSKASTANE